MEYLSFKSLKYFDKYHSKFIFFLQFSQNSDFLFSGGKDKKLRIMDLDTLTPFQEFDFVDSVFYSIELHSKEESNLYVSGKCHNLTRKFSISGELRSRLTSKKF
jgi:WD40 repeat protein